MNKRNRVILSVLLKVHWHTLYQVSNLSTLILNNQTHLQKEQQIYMQMKKIKIVNVSRGSLRYVLSKFYSLTLQ